jgi:Mce-associated membrane protein
VTAVLDTTEAVETVAASESSRASWLARAGALAIDVLLPVAVLATLAVTAWTAPWMGWLWWVAVSAGALTIVAMAVNRLLLPTLIGWTLGRSLFGIAVRTRDGEPVGILRLVGRDLAHLLDTAALFIGWLWPLWDRRNRTFADLLLRTEVINDERPQRNTRQMVGTALVVATAVCAVAVGLTTFFVYLPERAVSNARNEIAEQGPRLVEQMLTFKTETLQQDFSHAQSLTTESYRKQLVDQQQAILQAGAVTNEYFAVSSAVLSATADKAEMLVALQGQRGADPKDLKFITATLRVDFEKSDGQWRIANLTVLKKPMMNATGG